MWQQSTSSITSQTCTLNPGTAYEEKDNAMSNAKDVTDASFGTDVLSADKPVIVDFWAEWCGPCRKLGPILDEISVEYSEKVDVVKVNVDDNPGIAAEYGITSIPAVYLFQGGEVKSTVIGARPKQYFEKEFADVLS